jgi:hypothetical protein
VEIENIPNGERFLVNYVWDGQWAEGYRAAANDQGGWDYTEGWAELGELALLYDDTAFGEDHEDEFLEYDGSGDGVTKVCLYTYPGGVYTGELEEDRDYMELSEAFRQMYTDENGLRWVYVGYYMGQQHAWACVDDPLNEQLGTEEYLTAAQVRGQDEPLVPAAESVPGARTWVMWLIPAGLVVVAVLITALVWRKRKK